LVFTIGTSVNGGTVSGSTVNIAPSSVTNTSGGSSFMTYTVTYSTPVGPLSPDTTYYLNFETGGNGKAYYIGYNGNSTYSNGTYYKGGSDDGKDCYFKIFGSDISSVDVDVPTPNPATFASAPSADSDTAISMTATMGSDASNPVMYLFTETSGNPGGTSSSWQTSASYTDSGLDASTQYTYTVTMRDSAPAPNTGTASNAASATTPAAPVTIPDVTGQAQATAESNIVAAGLIVGTVSTSYSFVVPAGDVISQNPTGGASVPPGTSVDIEVSLGVEMVTVPDVVGLAQATAEGNIVAASLVASVTTAYSPTVPTGDVISQNPAGGASVPIDSTVDIVVSLGVEPVTVPNVVGQAQATAEGNIVAAGLVVGTVTTSYSGSVPAGDVISQDPTGGASAAPGSSVDI
ncbi:MAG: PASTA domain-containing protein, partial [Planctomycetes bacterium]|nr:PASTA domain-containing protein [Planctomycetota bacterium]